MNIQKILKAVLFALAVAGAWFAGPYILDPTLWHRGPVVAVQNGTSHDIVELYISNQSKKTDNELMQHRSSPSGASLKFPVDPNDCKYDIIATVDFGYTLNFEGVDLCKVKEWKIIDTEVPAVQPRAVPE